MKKCFFKAPLHFGEGFGVRLPHIFVVLITSCLGACTAVKPYQRQYINDSEMQMSTDSGKQYTQYIHSIRQGATPAGTPKSSGGCGCN